MVFEDRRNVVVKRRPVQHLLSVVDANDILEFVGHIEAMAG